MSCFGPADILLPREELLEKWAVIACDQFSSEPEYWAETERIVGAAPSALRLILPEAELASAGAERIAAIHRSMEEYLQGGVFREYKNAFVYVERTLRDGSVRQGVVGMLDLEAYDYRADANTPVRATEETVTGRIPPRMQIRAGAALELPHALLLCDDAEDLLIGLLSRQKAAFPKLYDFELMQGGGHVAGWLVEGVVARRLRQRLDAYAAGRKLQFAVGDGNHSLATARACWEALKKERPGEDLSGHPARYALVELENLRSPAQRWEAIHRLVTGCNAKALITAVRRELDDGEGAPIVCLCGGEELKLFVSTRDGVLPVARLQAMLDAWLREHAGSIDYIHGEAALRALCASEGAAGFLLPAPDKEALFPGIAAGGVLPRKTFSMGSAREKRYYLEARKLRNL